jgi:heterodisulfide reductase subunit C
MGETHDTNRGLPGEIAALPDGRDIDRCIQCGMCTASCPVSAAVPGYSPRQMVARALLGLEELLASEEIWYCARCQQCVATCRKDVRPADVITAVRDIALKRGYKGTEGARHTLAFMTSIASKGKLNEAMLPLRTLHLSAVKLLPYAARMLAKGKVPSPFLGKIEGIEEVRALVEEYRR